ncbi:MAG: ferrous iron transport protein A [Armatimonadota bacterium]|nr:MAG: ferrous iron transport protein A [Armatimonadota bacterium]
MVAPFAPIPLAQVPPGQRVRVEAVQGGRGLVSRMAALGIVPGTLIVVLSNARLGPVILDVRASRLALGRGQAARIIVRVIPEGG